MVNVDLTPVQVLSGSGVLLSLLLMWRGSRRRARAAADAARHGARVVSLAGRVIGTAALIVAVQWIVLTGTDDHRSVAYWLALAVPALLAALTVVRAVTVTVVTTRRGGGR